MDMTAITFLYTFKRLFKQIAEVNFLIDLIPIHSTCLYSQ